MASSLYWRARLAGQWAGLLGTGPLQLASYAAANAVPKIISGVKHGVNQIRWKMPIINTRKRSGFTKRPLAPRSRVVTMKRVPAIRRRGAGPSGTRRVSRRVSRVKKIGSGMDSAMAYTVTRARSGRRLVSGPVAAWKFVRSQLEDTKMRFTGARPFSSNTGGYFSLHNWCNTDIGGGHIVPFHIYDLNYENVTTSTSTTGGNGAKSVGYSLLFRNVDSAGADTGYKYPFYQQLFGSNAAGSDGVSAHWLQESGKSVENMNQVRGSGDMLSWFSANLMLYGCTAQPTRYTIMLCKFPPGLVHPAENKDAWVSLDSETEAVNLELDTAATSLQSIVRPYAFNPVVTFQARRNQHAPKVIKKWDFIIEARDTSDGDSSPNFRQVNIFHRLNQVCKYDYVETVPSNTANTMNNDGLLAQTDVTTVVRENVRQRDRHYLVIMAQAGYRSASGGPSADNTVTPTYDIQLRKKVTYLN